MEEQDRLKLQELAGEGNWSLDPLDLLAYSRDLAPLPASLLAALGQIPPELVARPRTAAAAAALLAHCGARGIPVTLRGAGSSALGGALPLDGGLVLDLNALNRVLEFDAGDGFVRVECGLEWRRLVDFLAARGFQCGANPSSGVSATIGGYLGTGGGAGIGVPRYGVLADSVLGLKVALADGRLVEANPWQAQAFLGAEGTLGLILEATLKVFPKPAAQRHGLLAFADLETGAAAYLRLAELEPYYLHLLDRGAVSFLNRAGGHLEDAALTVVFLLQGSAAGLARQEALVAELAELPGVRRGTEDEARREYEERYRIELSFKKLGPTLMLQEIRCPGEELGGVLADLGRLLRGQDWGVQSLSSDAGAVCLLIYVLTDERDPKRFFKAMSLAGPIPRLGRRHHGTVYGIGVHNGLHLKGLHSAAARAVMRELKARLDPAKVLNAGKTCRARLPGYAARAGLLGMRFFPRLTALGVGIAARLPRGLVRAGLRAAGGGPR